MGILIGIIFLIVSVYCDYNALLQSNSVKLKLTYNVVGTILFMVGASIMGITFWLTILLAIIIAFILHSLAKK